MTKDVVYQYFSIPEKNAHYGDWYLGNSIMCGVILFWNEVFVVEKDLQNILDQDPPRYRYLIHRITTSVQSLFNASRNRVLTSQSNSHCLNFYACQPFLWGCSLLHPPYWHLLMLCRIQVLFLPVTHIDIFGMMFSSPGWILTQPSNKYSVRVTLVTGETEERASTCLGVLEKPCRESMHVNAQDKRSHGGQKRREQSDLVDKEGRSPRR